MASLEDKARAVFELLHERAERKPDGCIEFTGSITEVFKQCGVLAREYSPIREFLISNGYVTYLVVGNRFAKSVLLLADPSEVPFDASELALTKPARPATLDLRRLERQVAELQEWRESLLILREVNLGKVLDNFEQRIDELEARVGKETGKK